MHSCITNLVVVVFTSWLSEKCTTDDQLCLLLLSSWSWWMQAGSESSPNNEVVSAKMLQSFTVCSPRVSPLVTSRELCASHDCTARSCHH